MESGNPFTYIFKDRDWWIRWLGGIGWWLLFFFVFVVIAITVVLPIAISAATTPRMFLHPAAIAVLVGGAIAGLLVLLVLDVIFGSIFYGYLTRLVANIAEGREVPLPRWFEDFGHMIWWGFLASIIILVWSLPAIFFRAASSVGTHYSLSPSGTIETHGTAAGDAFAILALLWQLFVVFILPVFFTRYAVTKRFGAAFQLGEIFRMVGNNFGKYALVFLLEIVAAIIAIAGVIVIGIGVLFTAMYAVFVIAGLWGFSYRDVLTKAGQPLPAGGTVPPTMPIPPAQPTQPTPPSEPVPPTEPQQPSEPTPPTGPAPGEPTPPNEQQPPSEPQPPGDNNPSAA
ncbi:MAG: DUF4013 domain-containing protein [Chloroflexi bacterium]|nr:DUF4013 domain-containing protein [Chloroflexota bacterium]